MRNVIISFLLFSFLTCKSQDVKKDKLPADSFEIAITNKNVQVLDVRTAGEYQNGHIQNAMQSNWNNQPEFLDRVQHIDKNKAVYVYCLAGGRSAAAASWMRNNGYKTVFELDGGINAWKKASKPLENVVIEKQLTIQEYNAKIPLDKITLVDFGATWCPPCIKMLPILDDLTSNNKLHFQLIKIDAAVELNIMKELNIESIPVFIVYKNGKETWRKTGIVTKEELQLQLQ